MSPAPENWGPPQGLALTPMYADSPSTRAIAHSARDARVVCSRLSAVSSAVQLGAALIGRFHRRWCRSLLVSAAVAQSAVAQPEMLASELTVVSDRSPWILQISFSTLKRSRAH